MFGTGERDVEQAEAFVLQRFLRVLLRRGFEHRGAAAIIVLRGDGGAGRCAMFMGPQRGQQHHRELEALAGVQGHQPHALRIGFEAQAAFAAGIGLFVLALRAHPVEQGLGRQPGLRLLLQQFAKMAKVGEGALAVLFLALRQNGEREFDQRLRHGQHAGPRPALPQRDETLAPGVELAVRLERGQGWRRQAEQGGQQGGAQRAGVARMAHGIQGEQEIARPIGIEHRLPALARAGHAMALQRATQGRDFGVRHQQHREVARLKGAIAEAMAA